MLTFEAAPEILQPYVPSGLQLDLWKGKAFVTFVGLHFVTKKVFGLHLPLLPSFDQINLRFYVRMPGKGKEQRGVVFIKEIVPRYNVSVIARFLFKQNYSTCPMSHKVEALPGTKEKEKLVEYSWWHNKKWQKMGVHGHGDYEFPVKGSREDFIVERYRGYSPKGPKVMEFQVAHPPWKIQQTRDATLQCEVGKVDGDKFGPFMHTKPAFALLAEGGEADLYYPQPLN